MIWIGYFFLILILLIFLLIFIRIKIELKLTKQEQWVEIRYLMLKYRFNLSDFLGEKVKTDDKTYDEKAETDVSILKKSKEPHVKKEVKVDEAVSNKKNYINSNDSKVKSTSFKKNSEIYLDKINEAKETEIVSNKVKSKKRWLKAPKIRRRLKSLRLSHWIKAPTVFSNDFIRKINLNFLQFQYRRFKFIYKHGKVILFRLFSKIKIHKLDSLLSFNIDEPVLNAHLIAVFWTIEANIYSFLQRNFKKVRGHKFDVKSQFSGNNIFLDLSCIVSFRIVDIIIVALLSLKQILTIKKLIKLEKEG